jgi:flavin reductase (DIM6/NTAB) family NADH-FMN oxidoreductase RutF
LDEKSDCVPERSFLKGGGMLMLARKALRRAVLGDADLPQQCSIAMRDPQPEVEVSLHGLGTAIDVTASHMIACASPSTIAVGLDSASRPRIETDTLLRLKFHQRGGNGVLLGQLGLERSAVVPTAGGRDLHLLEVRSCENHCVPRFRKLSYALFQAWLRARENRSAYSDVPMTARAASAMTVLFFCPRPVVLVSVALGDGGNMFPMNLMGPIGNGYFAFALNSRRKAVSLVERAGRVALSGIPFEQAGLARQLGKNHRREAVNWSDLPFPTAQSSALGIPVPAFATRVRELEIETVRKLGSHTLFVARIVRDESWSDSPQFFMIHGLYQARRNSGGQLQSK